MKIFNWLQLAAVIVVAVVLFFTLYRGARSGVLVAKSDTVLSDTRAIVQAFSYFHDDQGRYPSQDEFTNNALMSVYLTNFPPAQITGGVCNATFGYHTIDYTSYELHFCLPTGTQKFPAGINMAKR